MKREKKEKWTRPRHRASIIFLKTVFFFAFRFKYHLKSDKVKDKRPYLILFNHQTFWDQFFILPSLKSNKIYYLMSDDFDSMGFFSKIIRFTLKCIPFKKSSSDINAVKSIFKILKEGASVALSPEGNRTYTGETMNINDSIAKLIKACKVPVLFLNIHGFYAYPRFASRGRKANVSVNIRKILEYDEYKDLSNEELYKLVKEYLYVNDYDTPIIVKDKRRAEYLERVLYYCHKCGMTHFHSKGSEVKCLTCGDTYHLSETYTFTEGINKTIIDWDNYQRKILLNTKLSDLKDDYLITFDDNVRFSLVIPHKKKEVVFKECRIEMYKDRLFFIHENNKIEVLFEDIVTSGCFGNNKVNLILTDKIYQIKSDKRFNPLKYHIYKYKIEKGEIQNEFLGI